MTKRVAIIGMGGMGKRHIQAVDEAGLTLAAVCDLYEDAAKEAVKGRSDSPAIFTDWNELLKAPDFDLLIVATNGPSHHQIVITAAEAKVPYIFCEKPMTTSGAKAREMAQVCEDNGVKLAVNLCRRYMPVSVETRAKLQQGVIGEVRHFHFMIGAGGLGCIGTHYFDLPGWYMDARPVWVTGVVDTDPRPNVRGEQFLDPGGRCLVGYDNGVTALFECSGDVTRHSRGEIIGTSGIMVFDDLTNNEVMHVDFLARPEADMEKPPNWYVDLEAKGETLKGDFEVIKSSAAAILDLLGEGREDTIQGGIEAVDMVMAVHHSAKKGWDRVELPLTGDLLNIDIPIT